MEMEKKKGRSRMYFGGIANRPTDGLDVGSVEKRHRGPIYVLKLRLGD